MDDNRLKVLYTDDDMHLLLSVKFFEVRSIYSDRSM